MATLALTFLVFVLVFAGLAAGLLAGRGPIKGSCGGIAAMTKEDCPICGGNPARCESAQEGLGYEAAPARSAPERDKA